MESSRVWAWQRRENVLPMVTVASAFLLLLLTPTHDMVRRDLLHSWCYRSGKRSRDIPTPLDPFRSSLRRLWLA